MHIFSAFTGYTFTARFYNVTKMTNSTYFWLHNINSHNSVNFKARSFKFGMVVNFYSISLKMLTKMIFIMRMMMIMKMIMMMITNMMIELKMAITPPIFKLSASNFAWQFIQLVSIE